MLDGSIVKVHQDAMQSDLKKSAEAIGRCVGGLTSKIHAKNVFNRRYFRQYLDRPKILETLPTPYWKCLDMGANPTNFC